MTPITGWTVRYYPTDNSSDVTLRSHDANTNYDVITGLNKGTSYVVSVAASNSAGLGRFDAEIVSTLIDGKYFKRNV